jgi:hypothetical protein
VIHPTFFSLFQADLACKLAGFPFSATVFSQTSKDSKLSAFTIKNGLNTNCPFATVSLDACPTDSTKACTDGTNTDAASVECFDAKGSLTLYIHYL